MAGGNGASKSSNPTRVRKRVEAESSSTSASSNSLKRARDGSAFTKWCVFFICRFNNGVSVVEGFL